MNDNSLSIALTTSRGAVTVRPALPGDAVSLRELRLDALVSHPEAFGADHGMTKADPAEVWSERILDYASGSGVIYLALAQDKLIGMTGLVRGHWPKTRHSGAIWGVYVKAEWRGHRIAEGLLKACVAWAQGHGITVVKLAVVTTNASAIRCYIRSGFTVYGVEPQVIYHDGVFYDELLMARAI